MCNRHHLPKLSRLCIRPANATCSGRIASAALNAALRSLLNEKEILKRELTSTKHFLRNSCHDNTAKPYTTTQLQSNTSIKSVEMIYNFSVNVRKTDTR